MSIRWDISEIMRTISGAKLVIAEAMHAAIIADAYRVPWVSVATSSRINGFKWQDWASSLDMRHHFRYFSPLGLTNKVFNLTSGRDKSFTSTSAQTGDGIAHAVHKEPVTLTHAAKGIYKKVVPASWQGGKDLEFFSSIALTADRSMNALLKSGVYDNFFARAVEDIHASAAQPSMLSNDETQERKKTMLERLQEVRRYLADFKAH